MKTSADANARRLLVVTLSLCAGACVDENDAWLDPAKTTGSDSDAGSDASSDANSDASSGADSSTSGGIDEACGNGVVDPDEECDEGELNGVGSTCTQVCENNVCGDDVKGPGEACDDDSETCIGCALASCGDGVLNEDEECDDGNADNLDLCSNACLEAVCGDALVQTDFEECDDGNPDNSDLCTVECLLAECGDGYTQGVTGEECDDENNESRDECTNYCRAKPTFLIEEDYKESMQQGQGGQDAILECPVGAALVGLKIGRLDGKVAFLQPYCAPVSVKEFGDWSEVELGTKFPTVLSLGDLLLMDSGTIQCGQNEVVVGFGGNQNDIAFSSLKLKCQRLQIVEDPGGLWVQPGPENGIWSDPVGEGGVSFMDKECTQARHAVGVLAGYLGQADEALVVSLKLGCLHLKPM
jgi:cysteine-rich repeat protein